jgi:hypothetical protein
VSVDLLRGLTRLDDGDAFLWVEERAAISPIVRFPLMGDAARNVADAAAKIRRGRDDGSARGESARGDDR